jgi:chemotaxis receptor (MCP) glutamine deamidase CheD
MVSLMKHVKFIRSIWKRRAMYFLIKAPNSVTFNKSVLYADMLGLDPTYDHRTLTFDIGTGNIEKVTKLVDKFNLSILTESEYEPTGYGRY